MYSTLSSAVCTARELLKSLTPLKSDCGRFCGGACCSGDDQTGMLLFPGEEAFYASCSFGQVLPAQFSLAGRSVSLFVCRGTCPRDDRPLACRLFPLFLRFSGQKHVTLDPRAHALCPLCDFGLEGLDPAFVRAAQQAYDTLLTDPDCAAYLRALDEAFSL